MDGNRRRTNQSSRNRPKEWRRLEYLTDRIDDDDGEKWATVTIYSISSFKKSHLSHPGLSTSITPLLGNSIFQSRVLLTLYNLYLCRVVCAS
jgi:hypothetical protein